MTRTINIIELAETHGQTSYRNRADTAHPAFGFTEEGLQAFAHALLAAEGKCLHQIAEPAAPHAARDLGLAALEQYLKECEENQIVADVGGAFAYAWQRAAAQQAVQPVVPLPLLVRDIARDLGITVPEACIALKPLGNYSTNSAVTAEMARMLRDHFPARARAAEPMFWVRLCRDGLYEGPVHNNSASGKLQRDAKPEEWHPLYLHTAPAHPAEGVPAQRAAFVEAWQIINYPLPCNSRMRDDGSYADPKVQAAWEKWQARAAIAATQPAAQGIDALTPAARDVLAERTRQVEQEGYDPAHDDSHVNDEIAAMAAIFLMPEAARDWDASSTSYGNTMAEALLPADWNFPRLGNRRNQLVKGTAMALAEIERIDRGARHA